jgi:hypothetical protein
VAAECAAQDGEDVVFDLDDALAFSDGDFASAGDDALEGREADEGVAAHLLAAFDRFEQKALALRPGGAEEGGDRGFEVGREVRQTGTRVCSLASARNSLRLGWTGWAEAFTDPSVTGAEDAAYER